MRLHRALGWILAAQLLWAATAFGQDSYKVETIGAPTSSHVPKAVLDMLEPQGARLANNQGAALCEVWLRKAVPVNPGASPSSDIMYAVISEGTFLGVLRFPNPATDFRSQAIKAGFYTLRYALIPQDGNHMGVYPSRDTILLSPVAADKELDKTLRGDDLIKLSRQASGTPHPAFLVMAPVNGDSFPSVFKDEQGHWNLQLKVHVPGGDLPIAVTVVGKWQG
jgi:hypothetical protein